MNSPSDFLNNRSFYTVIGNNPNDDRKMIIPQAFWNDTKQALLPGPVFLKSRPQGPMWRVRLVEREERVYLRDGWAEFFEDNKLEEGDLLLFTHLEGPDILVKVCLQADTFLLNPTPLQSVKAKGIPMPSERPMRKEQPKEMGPVKPRGGIVIKEPTEGRFVDQHSGARIQTNRSDNGGESSKHQKDKGKAIAYEDAGKKYHKSRRFS